MFNVMNENEMMNVNGGFYYVPSYDANWNLIRLVQISSNSGIRYYYKGKAY